MTETANTTQDVTKIKESLGQEVVPAITGKPSRIIKDQHPKRPIKKVTAGGASLFEIAAAIREDPTIQLGEAIRQGKKEAKEREISREGGALHKGVQSFFKSALGNGIGGAIADIFANEAQKEEKKLAETQRQYEEGNKFKANFLKSLLGEKVGGLLARSTTLTSTKISAFEKYQELMKRREPEILVKPAAVKKVKKPKQITPKVAKPIKPKSSPQKEEAHKALMALGYSKAEAKERLAHAPEDASVEDLIKHGLNPTVKPVSKSEAASAIQKQIEAKPESAQAEAAATSKAEDTAHAIKEQKEHNKLVEKYLIDIKKKLDTLSEGSGGLMGNLLGAIKKFLSGPLGILKKVGPFLLRLFAKGGMVALAGILGYQVGKWLENKFHLSEHINDAIDKTKNWVQHTFRHIKNKITGAVTTREEAIKKGVLSYYDDGGNPQFLNKKDIEESEKITGKTKLDMDRGAVYEKYPQLLSRGTIQRSSNVSASPNKSIPIRPVAKISSIAAPIVNKTFAQQKELTDNKNNDMHDNFATIVASAVSSGTIATLSAIDGIKKMLPALAKTNDSDPGGVIVKLRNDESSQASYVAQIFDHPATVAGPGIM